VLDPTLINRAAEKFGSQCVVVAIDGKEVGEGKWEVYTHGGRKASGLDVVKWAVEVEGRGAGEILLTSMDRDGTNLGYDIPLTKAVCDAISIPVIASGGAGKLEHLAEVIELTGCDAVLAASIFHYGKYSVSEAKNYLASRGIEVRL
ncbi:MAG: HisA/HisF-related TIM barrel protein, partial [Actinomycetota bacterium]|nr:HisA/HisF-related TIM barrel protein [Actinomycetota bacterium]